MNERQRDTISIAITVIILGLLFILLLILGLQRPVPPPPEYGVEVNLGNSLDGMGDIQPDELSQLTEQAAAMPQETSADDNISTETSENVALKPQRKPRTPQPVTTPTTSEETPPQPEVPQLNPNALYTGRKAAQGGSEGVTGKPGDQGQPDGTKDGTDYFGTPGSGGGISFNLGGRQSKSLPKPTYNSDDQGTVVVKIWVNADGTVIKAQAGERGTTVNDLTLWRTAESAAMKSRFSADKNAPDQQVGTITYKFIKLN
ncbi:MAG: energy transducer TonB [Bacteroidales bacterium]|jgi:TonB family protein|nr:energy transducer TonB [Bacteroidales bacterium]